ncbi:hypothetical protein AC481_00230 [miscellaneous Crenarchaeota group archaeon SMTZ-80]|nr:MAG: hypothetical protein AC481_00230 [miscellaneous Crenarchaeota group archaeon SMTZ-80]
MKKISVKVFIYLFLFMILILPKYITNSKADIAAIYSPGTGNFLPIENCTLIMTNANASFKIDYPKMFANKIDISFTGNYSIYNPSESQNMTLVAPFSPDFVNLESAFMIKVDGNVTSFNLIEYNVGDSPWEQYLDQSFYGWGSNIRNFAVVNVTFPENDSIDIECSFTSYIGNLDSLDGIKIYYDVGTSRAWNGTITERVEFNVYGKIPKSYSECDLSSSNCDCSILENENGKIYLWEWENEPILINSVYISYSFIRLGRYAIFIIPLLYIGVPLVIGILIKKMKKKEKFFFIKLFFKKAFKILVDLVKYG